MPLTEKTQTILLWVNNHLTCLATGSSHLGQQWASSQRAEGSTAQPRRGDSWFSTHLQTAKRNCGCCTSGRATTGTACPCRFSVRRLLTNPQSVNVIVTALCCNRDVANNVQFLTTSIALPIRNVEQDSTYESQ